MQAAEMHLNWRTVRAPAFTSTPSAWWPRTRATVSELPTAGNELHHFGWTAAKATACSPNATT
jgi:hypothetical protein